MIEVKRTRAEALAAVEDEYRKILQAVQDYTKEDFEAPFIEGGRSPKDIFAHLAFWNWEAPSGLQRVLRDEMPYWAHIDLDELNAGVYSERQAWSLDQVMDDFQRSHTALLAALAQVTDEQYHRPTTHKYRNGTLDGVVWFFFIYYEHYDEHRTQLERRGET
jgi:hypothetical protein